MAAGRGVQRCAATRIGGLPRLTLRTDDGAASQPGRRSAGPPAPASRESAATALSATSFCQWETMSAAARTSMMASIAATGSDPGPGYFPNAATRSGHRLGGAAAAADVVVVGVGLLARGQRIQTWVAGQQRPLVRRAEVGEDQAAALLHGVPRLAEAVAAQAVLRLAGLIRAMAFDSQRPAMVGAADARLVNPAIQQRARLSQAEAPTANTSTRFDTPLNLTGPSASSVTRPATAFSTAASTTMSRPASLVCASSRAARLTASPMQV